MHTIFRSSCYLKADWKIVCEVKTAMLRNIEGLHRLSQKLEATLIHLLVMDKAPSLTSSPASCGPTTVAADAYAEYDLVIIGSGPSALALLSRILEERPAALYTEDERVHLHWLQRRTNGQSRGRTTLKTYKSSQGVHIKAKDRGDICTRLLRRCACPRVLVIDKLGEGWLGAWNRSFKAFEITHLRSPMFFHPSPSGLDDLLAYAVRSNRNRLGNPSVLYTRNKGHSDASLPDLIEICGVVGKEISNHRKKKKRSGRKCQLDLGVNVNERAREDFYTPSTDLFAKFIREDIVDRYGLPGLLAPWKGLAEQLLEQPTHSQCSGSELTVVKGEVQDLEWQDDGTCFCGAQDSGFVLKLASGETVVSKAVVAAVGPGGMPAVPSLFLREQKADQHKPASASGLGWCHSSALASKEFAFPPPHVLTARLAGHKTTAVVIGGGLTSAQIIDLCLKHHHFDSVILLLRGHLKCKPFDVGDEWMGKYSNLQKMRFWQEDDPQKRLLALRAAREGGSITPIYARILKGWEEAGKLEILPFSEVTGWKWIPEQGVNSITLMTKELKTVAVSLCGTPSRETITKNRDLTADYIVAATGAELAFSKLPFMHKLTEQHPVPMYGGLPMLTEDLQWTKDVPFFMIGAASALQVGPGAFNLGGIREAADRVATRLAELSLAEEGSKHSTTAHTDVDDYPLSFTHFGFETLSMEA
ncbi:hypothetical protein K437DRAFT_254193 [Tilletiaria anomala UBC 951]|uniref:L-ornithine N(5)-monooxygenase n=1 Tax=Tilletiaria anomala (strain ATCC 24038 / CBS 436.72 / UBC 951) TaxID=1037660 RepID=A0A066WIQ2_TILAU|nr:uncharacterized protein K437DRAFT_254193 [Tilletiaria anomala UBC 951]KDN52418.1 hypothetical protein K437DRAFT_254193 [Tilletiaria anomala UBC 951]